MVHLLKIDEIKHIDVDGSVLWEHKDLLNLFHLEGEYFLLNLAFNTSEGLEVPSSYYLGLDARTTPEIDDDLSSLSGEPTQNGYLRQSISSLNGFDVSIVEDNYRAISDIMTFTATGGSWGPVTNMFLATSADDSGYLISTADLESSRTLLAGQSITLKVSIGLTN